MKSNIYSYSAGSPNDWTASNDMCFNSIYRTFTYNELQASVDFTVNSGDVYFAVDSSFKYPTIGEVELDGDVITYEHMVSRNKDLPFKLHVPEKTTLSIGVTSNQDDPNPDDFIYPPIKSKSPTISQPTASPSVSEPTGLPSITPSISEPTEQPSFTDPSISPSLSDPTVTPSEGPTVSEPSKSPSTSPSYSEPTEQPSFTDPSQHPSVLPSAGPTSDEPSNMPTSSLPSMSPIPAAEVVATVVAAIAEETRQLGSNPLVDITYTTVIKRPWKLTNPFATGNAIVDQVTYELKAEGVCNTFTDLPPFLQSEIYWCQTWHLQFAGDRRCTTEARSVEIAYTAKGPREESETVDFSWAFDLGFSSAFDCSEDLGTFQIAIIVEGSSGDSQNFESPGDAYLDDWYYFRIGVSSGAPVTSVNIADLAILSSQGEPLCEDCKSIEALQIGVSDYSPDNFIVQLILDSSVFGGHFSTQIDFTFDITMSTQRRRRRLSDVKETEDEELIQHAEKVTLMLRQNPNPEQAIDSFKPTAVNPRPPTPKPVEAVKEAASKDLANISAGSSGSMNGIYAGVGGVSFLIIVVAAVRYFRTKGTEEDDIFEFAVQETQDTKEEIVFKEMGGADILEIS